MVSVDADRISTFLIAELAQISSLRVISRASVMQGEIGRNRWLQFGMVISKAIDEDLKPGSHSGRFGTQDGAQPLTNLLADRATVQAVNLQMV